MRITVFGASGKVGRIVVRRALERGYQVTAFVHKNNPFDDVADLHIVTGDIYSGDDVRKAIADSDAVLSCLGSWGQKTPQGNRNVLSAAMERIIPAMTEHHIDRIVTLTGAGAAEPHQEMSGGHKLMMKILAPFPVGKVFADGERHMHLLLDSPLDWTTIRAPVMNGRPEAAYTLKLEAGGAFPTVSREAVAASMLDQLESDQWSHQAPALFRKAR